MFTGIVSAIGQVNTLTQTEGGIFARIDTPFCTGEINVGASISCDGVCLTVVNRQLGDTAGWFEVDISKETLRVTNLHKWVVGMSINLERAMRIGDEIGGHIVSGHIDAVTTISEINPIGDNKQIRFKHPKDLAPFIAQKGSVCLNGTSLTVNDVDDTGFYVNLIPHTIAATTWQNAVVGDEINLEIDMLARYVARLRTFETK